MPPDNDAASKSQSSRRPGDARVLPAIPLPLSKKMGNKTSQKPSHAVTAAAHLQSLNQTKPAEAVNGDTRRASGCVAVAYADKDVSTPSVRTPVSLGSQPMLLSNGATPEHTSTSAIQSAASPAAVPSPAVTIGPTTVRRPADNKLDTRPVRTELPPAFVPSAEHYTSRSSASSGYTNMQARPEHRAYHPSASSIVFGGHESPTSSPAPPQSADSAFQRPISPPGGSAYQASHAFQGHGHHVSEPFPQRHFPPAYGPPGIFGSGHRYPQPVQQMPYFQPHGSASFRYPPPEVFTPAEARQSNGYQFDRSRSASQTSSAAPKTADDLQSPMIDGMPSGAKAFSHDRSYFNPVPLNIRHHQPHHAPPTPPLLPPDVMENAESIRAYIFTQFGNPASADCHLQITDERDGVRHYFDGSKLILSRSAKLMELIYNSDPPHSAALKTQVHITLEGRYVCMRPFIESIRYLYGGPFPSLQQPRFPQDPSLSNADRMRSALENLATAAWLQLPGIANRGLDVAAALLHWDTISPVLAFALDGGLGPTWNVDDGSEDKISCSSSDDSSCGKPESVGSPTYDPLATELLRRMIDFTIHVLPSNFYLDSSAPQLESCPRLPLVSRGHASTSSRSDPRLSQIRFGEVPADDHQRPSPITTAISSVLLSLPFALLKCILEHNILAGRLGSDTMASIMRQVIAERERRRQKALKAHPASRTDDAAEAALLQNLYWVEEVEPSQQHRAGFRLARKRRGIIDTPPSSGVVSE
ncbi:hypothetical protein Tdes44962_MAKER04093 [Teratosphaeria destructans]|uniref:Uncharacterized protein n=1 Tax=Teratosphaeria destructans TaxID=418781 RepID=A0A9W7SNC6_9PEZI|nr:hypothetical protein Tdes44962_MAKER04093 [Teratosphaeria destructans]